jgi:DNA invertase Pin-like site-specific DNA recombinase
MMKAAIYCRVSTKEQTQNLSLPTQLRACRELCDREGVVVAREFTDAGESAKTTDRPEFLKLLEFCRANKGKIQYVVVYNIARLSRNVSDFAMVKAILYGLGISVRSVTEPIADDTTGKLLANMLAAIAQFDNDAKSDRTKAGMKAALERGRWPFKAPLGYLSGSRGGKGLLVVDPVRGPLVRAAFEEYATGRHTKTEVLRRVTALGLTTQAGKPLTAQSLCSLLRNRIYAGWLHVPRLQVSGRGDFEALVPESMYRRVQALLDGKGVPLRRHVRDHHDFPLRRFVACSHCLTPLTGSWSTGRAKKYAYYHCRKCRRVKTAKGVLEAQFVELLSALRPEAGHMRLFNAIIMDVWKSRQSDVEQQRRRLEGVVRQKRERLDRVDEAFLHERSIDKQTYERQRDQLRQQVMLAEIELNDAVLDQLDIDAVLAFAEHVVTNSARLWTELDLVQKQRLQQVLFPEGLRFDGERFGTAVTCLAFNKLNGIGGSDWPFLRHR